MNCNFFCNFFAAYENGQHNEEPLRFAPDSPWALIYDMEAMFPDKKQQEAQQISYENVCSHYGIW